MKSNLYHYIVFGILNLYVIYFSFLSGVTAYIQSDVLYTLMFSIIFSFSANDFLNRQRNFAKYYPNFPHLWTH